MSCGQLYHDATAAGEAIRVSARHRALGGPRALGGDFFALCDTPYGARLILGDVRGKGTQAARQAIYLKSLFLMAATTLPDLESVSGALEHTVSAHAALGRDEDARETFATAVLAEIDAGGRTVTMINHGHPSPVLLTTGPAGTVRVSESVPRGPRLPLGLGHLAPSTGREVAEADTVVLEPGSALVMFTDGLSEARDAHGRLFDPCPAVARAQAGAPELLLETLMDELEAYQGGMWRDDLALLSVRRAAASASWRASTDAGQLDRLIPAPARPPVYGGALNFDPVHYTGAA